MTDGKGKRVIDTNVPVIANQAVRPDTIPCDLLDCVETCCQTILRWTKTGVVVLDQGGEIFEEYLKNLHVSGQPGVGDQFLQWVHDHQYNSKWIERVEIHKEEYGYKEFPDHPKLQGFDPSDRKFVATATAHPDKPPILQATDSKWWGWKDALEACGVTVEFVCQKYIESTYQRKRKRRIRE